jgi:hypothetical protein
VLHRVARAASTESSSGFLRALDKEPPLNGERAPASWSESSNDKRDATFGVVDLSDASIACFHAAV